MSSPESRSKLNFRPLSIFNVFSSYDFIIVFILLQTEVLPELGIENGSIKITLAYLYYVSISETKSSDLKET